MLTTILNVVEDACTIATGHTITTGLVETLAYTETILRTTIAALLNVLRQVNLAMECALEALFCVKAIVTKKIKFPANVLM